MATVDYMIASYGPYSASATGGNGFARDFLAGIAAMYSVPSEFLPLHLKSPIQTCLTTCTVYSNMGKSNTLEWPSTLLGFLAILFTIPIYVFYWFGPTIREKSPFAQTLAADRKKAGRRVSACGSGDPDPVQRYLSGSSTPSTGRR